MILLLVITDGRRDCVERAIPSAQENLRGPITRRVIYDDSGDEDYRQWLLQRFPAFEVVHHPHGRQGFGGAIRTAWRHIGLCHERYVFHLEDDFTFNRPIDLQAMMLVLENEPNLVQLALRRQPWNDAERDSGGIIEQHPDAYLEVKAWGHPRAIREVQTDWAWLEHRQFFTTNPSLYRRALCARGWPDGAQSEGHFTHQLLEDPELRFGFWGARDSGEWVTHIGDVRAGTGY